MPSFDVTSGCDLQEVENALNQARKELTGRFDFKGVKWSMDFRQKENLIVLQADDGTRLKSLVELLRERMVKRGVSIKNIVLGTIEPAAGGSVRQQLTLTQGVPVEKAKEIVKFLKDAQLKKVQGSIQGDAVRVTGPKRDDLQAAIAAIRQRDFGLDLKFGNFRD